MRQGARIAECLKGRTQFREVTQKNKIYKFRDSERTEYIKKKC